MDACMSLLKSVDNRVEKWLTMNIAEAFSLQQVFSATANGGSWPSYMISTAISTDLINKYPGNWNAAHGACASC